MSSSPSEPSAPTSDARGAAPPIVLLVGNPNSGKTTVFNLLTGSNGKVGNYPGITVDRRSAPLVVGGRALELVDLPGTYSLTSRSMEEEVAVDAVLGRGLPAPSSVVLLADATTLRRGLYLAMQVLESGVPAVLAITMMDEARARGLGVDVAALSEALGCEVVPMVASRGEGRAELLEAIGRAEARSAARAEAPALPPALEAEIDAISEVLARVEPHAGLSEARESARRRSLAAWALLSLGDDELEGLSAELREAVADRHRLAKAEGRSLDIELVAARYARIDALLDEVLDEPVAERRRLSERIDDVLVHPVWGLVVFAIVMALVFQALFSWSEPAIGLIEAGVESLKALVGGALAEGPFRDLLLDGVIAGVGNVVVFVPQIALLFVFVTVLEDSGYLARVAFVIDRVMGGVGLHGKAFVPMLSGFACAIPAVMATRTIESRRDRLLTMLVVPLTSCSARLPVYVLVIGAVFSGSAKVFGLIELGAVVLFSMYALSVLAAIGAAAVLRRTVLRGPRPTMLLELPPYRRPRMRNVALATWERVRRFLVDAGTVILALTIVLWAGLTYPKDEATPARLAPLREAAASIDDEAERNERLAALEAEEKGAALRHSVGGRIGTAIEPALEPLGFDYRIGIGILGAFAAREVFVSTLGIAFDVGEADEESAGLRDALRSAKRRDGTTLMTPLAGVSLMVFFVLACQCMSTIAVVRRESGSWKWPGLMFAYMSLLAYGAALLVYQGGKLFGWG